MYEAVMKRLGLADEFAQRLQQIEIERRLEIDKLRKELAADRKMTNQRQLRSIST
jgi:hypothetical protein